MLNSVRCLLDLKVRADEILVIDQTEKHEAGTEIKLQALSNTGRIDWIKLDKPSIPNAMNEGIKRAGGDLVLDYRVG